jgi:hypothetical protein
VSLKLVNHNDDLRRLVERGYAVSFDSGYLIVRDIPYLDAKLELRIGAIVTKLEPIDAVRVAQVDHQVFFAGDVPYNLDGAPIRNLGGGVTGLPLSERAKDVMVQRSFSNKPRDTGKFADFFEKIESYVSIISGPAMNLHGASPYTARAVLDIDEPTVFKFHDSLTSRAEIGDLAVRFRDDVVAIIGLGGTGAYVLDFLVKTPVREIRGFDPDSYRVHNAYRSPGRLLESELGQQKATVYQDRYDCFRHGLTLINAPIDATSLEELKDVTFAFVCVDSGPSRAGIFDALIQQRIPFIDVGMGLKRKHGPLNGMLRATYFSAENADQVRQMGLAELAERDDNLYRNNVQIAELNALNACLAVVRYKQLRGFYQEDAAPFHLLFEVGDLSLIAERHA